jgi:phosphoglycolate phosphatase
VLELVDALEGSRGRAVLIGDSTVDVAAARAAGIPVIVMSYGYTAVAASELGADAVADDFSALPELISRLARNQTRRFNFNSRDPLNSKVTSRP